MLIRNLFKPNSTHTSTDYSNSKTTKTMTTPCPGVDNTTVSPATDAAELPSNSTLVAPIYCSACSVQLPPFSSSASVIHNPEQDLRVTGSSPKTPPGIAEMKGSTDHLDSRPQDTRRAPEVYMMTPDDDCDFTKASPNNTPLVGLSLDSYGSMNKPSPNNTPMCDRYVQDRGAKYPDIVPDASASPNRTKDGCEVMYGGANPRLNRDNGSSWSVLNHVIFGKK